MNQRNFCVVVFAFLFLFFGLFGNIGCGGGGGGSDLSFDISPQGDFDGDGVLNENDADDDNDGVLDTADAFPFDPDESADLDNDGVGDNTDLDADGDTVAKGTDCNDLNAAIFPGASDVPDENATDANCDGIDGDLSRAIWVSTDEGLDANAGTITSPVRTIGKGVQLSQADPSHPPIHVVKGEYSEDVRLTDGISIFGGFSLLNANNLRSRDIQNNETKIIGNGLASYSITFANGFVMNINYLVLTDTSDSTIQGFRISCGIDGVAVILSDSSATFENNKISCPIPGLPRTATVGVATFITDLAAKNFEVHVRKNTIDLNGTANAGGGRDFGILAIPERHADRELTLIAEENDISLKGASEVMTGIYAADDDFNPADADDGDLRASLKLFARRNSIDISGTSDAKMGIFGGGHPSFALLPNQPYFFLERAEITRNTIHFEPANPGAHMGILVALTRENALVANNALSAESSAGMEGFGIVSTVASTDVLNNSYHVDGDQIAVAGVLSMVRSDGIWANYTGSQMGVVANNIFSFASSTALVCQTTGLHEVIPDGNIAHIGRVSPLEFKNNDIFFDTTCAETYYVDAQGVGSLSINDLTSLHNKTGFTGSDPTVMSGNISVDPLFTDPDNENFSLQSNSLCVNAGATLANVTEDIQGASRPQGAATDIGAYEFSE